MGFAKRKPSGNHVPMVRIQIGSFARRFHGVPFGKLIKLMGKRFRFMRQNGIVPTIHDKVATHYYSCFARKETRDY